MHLDVPHLEVDRVGHVRVTQIYSGLRVDQIVNIERVQRYSSIFSSLMNLILNISPALTDQLLKHSVSPPGPMIAL